MQPISRCPEHDYTERTVCPACERDLKVVLDGDRRRRLSTFVSGALRHFPEDVGIELDERGWTTVAALTDAVDRQYDWASDEHLAAVLATDPKGRFERDGDRVRAAYGHSVAVTLDDETTAVPDRLYHGTAPRHVAAIEREGLRPMDRQLVHLSGSVETAREVGARHAADPVVFVVDAAGLAADGYDITERGEGVFTVERVPPAYLSRR
jgi:putative RNA 2'-phosphotransferase